MIVVFLLFFFISSSSPPPPPPSPHLQLRLRRVLAQRAHDGAELFGRDGPVAVLVEEGEGLLF